MLSLVNPTTGDSASPPSQTTAAYARLRQDILSGRYLPGHKLKIAELSTRLEVSPGAVREALSRLVPEHLVVSRDQRGFVVAPLSIEDLVDLTELRCEIESIALRRSVELGEVGWEASVLARAHRLRRTPKTTDDGALSLEWVEHHAAFHTALVSACGSPRLLALHNQLYEQSERYRGLTLHLDADRPVEDEHQGLVDAALDRDADRLVSLAVAHFRQTTNRIVEASRKSPDSIPA